MKVRIVSTKELDPAKGLRAQDYIPKSGYKEGEKYLFLAARTPGVAENEPGVTAFRQLNIIAAHCFSTAVDKGWWMKFEKTPKKYWPEVVASKIALIHSEASEALEEIRTGKPLLYFASPDPGVKYKGQAAGGKPEGVAAELADIVIRVFDLAAWLGIDIGEVIRLKMKYNHSRPHLHGGKKL